MLPGLELPQTFRLGHWQLCYQPAFLDPVSADALLESLLARDDWYQPDLSIHGRQIPVPRLVTWEGDPGVSYGYSGHSHTTRGWHPPLEDLRDRIQQHSGYAFNYALLNYYRDGNDAISWHRDNEVELGEHPMVASVSLGAERDFHLRAEHGAPLHRIRLEHGSLLLMPGKIMHHLPRRKGVSGARINISFRCVQILAPESQ